MKTDNKRFKTTPVARALYLAFCAAAFTAVGTPTAFAQSNATGVIFGQAAAAADSSIVIENVATGAKRTIAPDAGGRFRVTALPVGQYKVTLMKGGKEAESSTVEVLIGQGAEVKFGSTLAAVEVVGRRQTIDVSSSNNGTTFTAKELDTLPVARDVNAIIQLAPNTTRGDPRLFGAASFGGGAASENSYYINGFPVTNPLYQLGTSQLPFSAIAQAQVLTGGFGAEFGRSIGGVVNITTKSGGNKWQGGVSMSVTPASMRAAYNDVQFPNTGANPTTDGTLYRRRADNKVSEITYGGYVGGPIIQDKLFMFVAVEQTEGKFSGVNSAYSTLSIPTGAVAKWGWREETDKSTRSLAKFDWNLTNDHRLELTVIGDNSTAASSYSGYDYTTRARNGVTLFSTNFKNIAGETPVGLNDTILKYTGNLTDDLTITALTGIGKSKHSSNYAGGTAGGSLYTVSLATASAQAPGITYNNPQALSNNQNPADAEDKVKSTRFDLEWKINNQHTLRAGLDNNKLSSYNAGDFFPGGGSYSYRATTNAAFKACGFSGCIPISSAAGLTNGSTFYYVRQRNFTDVTDAFSDQSAQYIEDRYQATKDLLLAFGLRSESFANKNNVGETFLEQKKVLSPRFGAAWDVNGDSSMKVFGSAGRYNVQIPTHLAVRGAGPSTFLQQYFTYTGVGPDGAPTGLKAISPRFSPDGEEGQAKDHNVLSATNLKPNQQDEITIGFEKALNPDYNFGAKFTYRKMLNTIDDFCDDTPFYDYADKKGINTDNYSFNCVNMNPGRTNTFLVDYAGTGKNYTPVTLTAADMGFDTNPARRSYKALDFFLEHPLKDKWYGKLTYTWSRSMGNTEGQTLSDIGQTDVAATQAWDFGQLMENSYGRLPNDRTHQIKAFGYYNLTPEWTIGANALIASGRPRSCIGAYPVAGAPADAYGSASHYCNGVAAPRGTAGYLPWDHRLDMNVVYKPQQVKGLALRMDVFNLFNKQHVEAVDETYQIGGNGSSISPTYGRVLSYTAPRYFKFTATYDF